MNPDLQSLISRVAALEKWRDDRIKQQVTYPLDVQSQIVLNKYFLAYVSNLDFTNSNGLVLPNIIMQQDGQQFVVAVQQGLYLYTANASTNVLTIGKNITNGKQGSFSNGDQVFVNASNTTNTASPPSPLVDNVPYYVVNASGNTIKLSLTLGGSAIDLTNTGTGTQYVQFFT